MRSIVVVFGLLASFIFAEEPVSEIKPEFVWPIQGLELPGLITSTFGESRKDHFHNGLDISSVFQPVKSMSQGFVLYSRYAEDDPFEEERGSGNIVWIAHKNGYVSGYYHLGGTRNDNVRAGKQVSAGDTIGISGNTGHSTGGHLHFVLGKDYGKTLLDPLAYLPPVEDNLPPQIVNLFIHVGENYTNLNDGDNINVSKAFPLTVSILDGGIKNIQRRGIKEVKFVFNGENYKQANFESLRFEEGKWKTKEGHHFDDLFFKDRYLVGVLNLKAGENVIKVQAKDFSGQSAERSFSINITRISGGN
ncbi:M23 family metallopeptidase [Leptospira sp. 2 VSF19]|uniref:M23 family metallopeptidase n=1 Tax=Leptospira soteropolitanensis TaxID=2950025 RepID=A0AAW5VBX9_9LEPT|nr:M23 family metallopeptidase [Leptospira soteropolitanensis]MCW7491044.1 M23 family metallopeptidase [Leptospira soteropolitanensis]MCW7498628.1 M23 family metallopeptidase [Leptospira soteropolitanensis]MCW7521779.1 M23 family metallopeptidase [Leptospira soteropolitanensis]MCW7524732.1 M23 family metallopeptidase [Leptospira soteropolitanensis]MCW7528599.1 M23 family metallopeptidase [Leptospira soteropolitanensis]